MHIGFYIGSLLGPLLESVFRMSVGRYEKDWP